MIGVMTDEEAELNRNHERLLLQGILQTLLRVESLLKPLVEPTPTPAEEPESE